MKKNTVIIILLIAAVLGILGCAATFVLKDHTGPKIKFVSENQITCKKGEEASILDKITATDYKDGDVSDTLVLEAVYPHEDRTGFKAVVAAFDRSNNVTRTDVYVVYR